MSASLNRVTLIGNVGQDPEIRTTQTGDKVANFSVATSQSWKDKSGERKEKTEWHRIVLFNPHLIDVVEKYVRKGSRVYLEGALQTRSWTDNSGATKYSTEIVAQRFKGELLLLDSKKGEPAAAPDDLDDQVPF